MVSASLLGSSIWLTETSTSGGTFLLSFTYCSNWLATERPSASSSPGSPSSSSIFSARASKNAGFSWNSTMRARSPPSTRTLTVPSGSLRSCSTEPTTPTEWMSLGAGSSWEAFFCATRRICLSSFMTVSSAATDFSRPTKSGTIMCGKTTMSLSGRTG